MKKLSLLLVAIGCFAAASAQRAYFVFFQTEDGSAFYVRMAEKIFSSTASGYLILPNLVDSTYTIHLGFAKNTEPETKFAVTVNRNDKGYLIKNFADGLGLFDMQELIVVRPSTGTQSAAVYETRSDHFSAVLSKAADDPSLLRVAVAAKEVKPKEEKVVSVEEPKPVSTAAVDSLPPTQTIALPEKTEVTKLVEDSVIATTTTPVETTTVPSVTQTEPSTSSTEQPYKRSTVRRYAESSTTEGLGVVYFDRIDEVVDTIRILIPPSKIRLEEAPVQTTETSKPEAIGNTALPPALTETAPAKADKQPETKSATSLVGNCASMASEKDFIKLRKGMAGKETDEDMITEAKKSFKNKCYTTEQVRYLGSLFLTSAARYQFFDAAYNHVSDKEAFSSLQSEIKDEYYLKRFKALIGE